MAKVKNQVYEGSEEAYTDANGWIYYTGEMIRHCLTDGYPLPSFDDQMVVRKSPGGFRNTQQGRGSQKQAPWRDCFSQCAERWNALPDVCPAAASCIKASSKKNIWDAKVAQGVMCSYIDLYMGCCMSYCTEVSITGPDGSIVKGGIIPADDFCWPCISPCLTSTLSISYTTAQMIAGNQQALYAHDSLFGDSVPCCPDEDLIWTIGVGGGYLNPATGPLVIYTAPSVNVNCSQNATIELHDCCGRSAAMEIAVTKVGDPAVRAMTKFERFECTTSGGVAVCKKFHHEYNCIGADIGNEAYVWCGYMGSAEDPDCHVVGCPAIPNCLPPTSPDLVDYRTDEMLADACCPEEFL